MKRFLITFTRESGTESEWHQEVRRFVEALDRDPELAGRISYRSLKAGAASGYYHIATVADETAVRKLQERDYFKHYTEQTRRIAGGKVETRPLELVAETSRVL